MRVVLVGSSGGIGTAIKQNFEAMDYDVLTPQRLNMDLAYIQSVEHYFEHYGTDSDVVVYSAGRNHPECTYQFIL